MISDETLERLNYYSNDQVIEVITKYLFIFLLIIKIRIVEKF